MGTSSEKTEQELPEAYWPGLLFYNQSEVGKLLLSWLVDAFMWKFGKFDLSMKNDHFFASWYSYSVWKCSCPVPSSKNILFAQIIFMKTMHPAYKRVYTNTYSNTRSSYFGIRAQNLLADWRVTALHPFSSKHCRAKMKGAAKEVVDSEVRYAQPPPFGSSLAGSWSVFEPEPSAVFWVRGQPEQRQW